MAKINKQPPGCPETGIRQRVADWLQGLGEFAGRSGRLQEQFAENRDGQMKPHNEVVENCEYSYLTVRKPVLVGQSQEARTQEARTQEAQTLDGQSHAAPAPGDCLLAGSFNPLHAGHLEIAQIAKSARMPTGLPGSGQTSCWFEICIANVDKAALDLESLLERLDQEFGEHGVLLSNAPTFVAKARLFPNAVFAVGADTIERICQLTYYQDRPANLEQAISTIKQQGCRFLVFGRELGGEFVSGRELGLPTSVAELCQFVDESEFRVDVSSTEIRSENQDL